MRSFNRFAVTLADDLNGEASNPYMGSVVGVADLAVGANADLE